MLAAGRKPRRSASKQHLPRRQRGRDSLQLEQADWGSLVEVRLEMLPDSATVNPSDDQIETAIVVNHNDGENSLLPQAKAVMANVPAKAATNAPTRKQTLSAGSRVLCPPRSHQSGLFFAGITGRKSPQAPDCLVSTILLPISDAT